MADYNVNMKQWNGSSFDNVLPLAYNSNQLGGKTYDDIYNTILQYVGNNFTKCEVIKHIGTSTSASSTGTRFTFSFPPKVVIAVGQPYDEVAHSSQSGVVETVVMIYMDGMSYFGDGSFIYTSFSVSGNTLTMKGSGRGMTSSGTHGASWECNYSGVTYFLCAFA